MCRDIKDKNGKTVWFGTAKTSRGFNQKQKKAIADILKRLQNGNGLLK